MITFYQFSFSSGIFQKAASRNLLNLVSKFERPAGNPPLMFGASDCAEDLYLPHRGPACAYERKPLMLIVKC